MLGAGLPNPPMELGTILTGTDDGTTTGNLINAEKLGQIYVFPASRMSNLIRGAKSPFTGRPLTAVLLRNNSGITLLGKRLGQLSRVAGYAPCEQVLGYSTVLGNAGVVLIDPFLPSSGVPDKSIFWGILRGPALCLLPLTSTGHADISVNDPLVGFTGTTTGATTSGRITKVQFIAATSGETGAGLQAFTMAYNTLGRALSARTSQETTAGADILVDFAIRQW